MKAIVNGITIEGTPDEIIKVIKALDEPKKVLPAPYIKPWESPFPYDKPYSPSSPYFNPPYMIGDPPPNQYYPTISCSTLTDASIKGMLYNEDSTGNTERNSESDERPKGSCI